MALENLLDGEQFLLIAELEPPKGVETSEFEKNAEALRGRVNAVLVPEMSGAIMRMGSLGAAHLLKQRGIETIVSMNCRDRNRLALQADMLSAFTLGLENLVIVEGDQISGGDHIDAQPVNDLDLISALEVSKKLQKGVDAAGNELVGMPHFNVGSEVNAGLTGSALEVEVMGMEKKIKAGAKYFFTPTMYDLNAIESFMKKVAPFKIPVFPRVTVLNSVGMARFMCRHLDGVLIPDETLDRLGKAPDKTKEGIAIAADAIKAINNMAGGVLLVAIGGQERLAAVAEQI
ncbi:MAG: methylenetetrahydrofolate reductase [Thermodesulfobacteriota bacterium]|nr:methylenetetrahydrofolate reductase [Thermodesulfobacteriota bacterium]